MVFERYVEKDEEVKSVTYVDAKLQRKIDRVRVFLCDLKRMELTSDFICLRNTVTTSNRMNTSRRTNVG